MSDSGVVNIAISVEQAEIDAAIASLDEALNSNTYKPRSPRKEKFVSKYATVPDNSWVDKDQLRILDRISNQKEELGYEIKGLDTAVHRIARMIPGVREVDRVYKNIRRAQGGYALMAGINFVLIAFRVIRMINQYLDQLKRQRQEMEAYVRQIQGFSNRESYNRWHYQQRVTISNYRNVNR